MLIFVMQDGSFNKMFVCCSFVVWLCDWFFKAAVHKERQSCLAGLCSRTMGIFTHEVKLGPMALAIFR
jgi:hypothetical protein